VMASNGKKLETDSLLDNIPPEQINSAMLTSVLTAYSHNGCAKEAWALLQKIKSVSQAHGKDVVGINAYTAVVDAYARIGEFDSALDIVQKAIEAGITPDAVMWVTILSPCRHYNALSYAEEVFNKILSLDTISDEMITSAYVLMADIYKACGHIGKAEDLHKERLARGLIKERGAVTTTIQDKTYTFYVNEIPPELSEAVPNIQAKLDEWSLWLISQGVSVESIQCRHSEKLALASAVIANEKNIVLRKNLRVCSACHEASVQITKLEGITIHHWDRSRLHVMENGKCSCGGFY